MQNIGLPLVIVPDDEKEKAKLRQRVRRLEDPEKLRAIGRKSYAKHKEKRKAAARGYIERNKFNQEWLEKRRKQSAANARKHAHRYKLKGYNLTTEA